MMKKVLLTLVMLLVAVSPALAFDLGGYLGPIQFKYNNWDFGTIYDPETSFDNGGEGTGDTNSYGIFQVTQVLGQSSGGGVISLWTPTTTESLKGYFYGLSDDKVDLNEFGQGTIYSVGGTIEMYLGADNLTPNAGPGVVPALGDAPIDIWNATDGVLFLKASFVPGAVLTDGTTTYAQQINSIANPLLGSGLAYLNITGGSYATTFDSNGYLGGAADLKLQANYDGPGPFGWTAESFDPVRGAAVPEPASMILMGIGLAGAARLRRRTA